MEADEHLLAHANATHKYFDDIVAIKEGIANDDFVSAGGAWFDLHNKASRGRTAGFEKSEKQGRYMVNARNRPAKSRW